MDIRHTGCLLLAALLLLPAEGSRAQQCPAAGSGDAWQKLECAGDAALAGNNYGVAERNLTEALAAAEKFGSGDIRLAKTLHSLGSLYSTRGQFARAEPCYERELRAREKALGCENPQVVAAVGQLAQFYLNHGSCAKADRLVGLLSTFAERKVHDEQALKDSLNKIDRYYDRSAGFGQARSTLQKLKTETDRTTANENLELATTLDRLGHIYQGRGKNDTAERLFKDALAFRERVLAPEHLALAFSYENLAGLYSAEGKSAAAAPLYKKALAITEQTLQPGRPEVYERLDRLAQSCVSMGQIDQAEALYRRALQVMEHSSSCGDVGRASLALGQLYVKQGRFASAEPLMKRALAAAESANGPQHASLAPILDSYATVLEHLNKGGQASHLRARARSIRGVAVAERNDNSDF